MFHFLSKLFSRQQWETVYFTQNIEEYAQMKNKLLNHNIEVKTRTTISNLRGKGGHWELGQLGAAKNSYEVLVKVEDVYKANDIIHHS